MTIKQPKEFTTEEVLLWLVAIGLGDKQTSFKENSIDGDMLVNLSQDDFQNDLRLTKLQAMKVIRSIEQSNQSAPSPDGTAALNAQIQALQSENVALRAQLDELMKGRQQHPSTPIPQPPTPTPDPAPQAPPAPNPVPAQKAAAAPPKKKNEHHVVKGAAGGAAKGALLGAVGGAIAGDAGKGAKIGAAVGATGGGMKGLGQRRRARMVGRRG